MLTTLVVKNKTMDAKKLKQISAELKKASALHKGQAVKIDKMLKSIKQKNKIMHNDKAHQKADKGSSGVVGESAIWDGP